MRVSVYVDGFNLYYGIRHHGASKWLDLHKLSEHLLPGETITAVRYYTADIAGHLDVRSPMRQEIYQRALRSLPTVTIHKGHFTTHPVWMPLASPSATGPFTVEVLKTEEKGSDVNLATGLLTDGFDGLYDAALVISNDSDLAEPVNVARARFGPVFVVAPNTAHSNDLARAATRYTHLHAKTVRACQLPDPVVLPDGTQLSKPAAW